MKLFLNSINIINVNFIYFVFHREIDIDIPSLNGALVLCYFAQQDLERGGLSSMST
jgi:hypothetical protein